MKRDINLLPRKKSDPKKTTGVIVAVVVTSAFVLVFGLGFMIPKGIKDDIIAYDEELGNQITQLQPQVDEYEALKDQLSLLRDSLESTGSISFSKYDAADALEIIKNTCPTGVIVKSMSNSENTLSIDCLADNNYQIAQFALELERSGNFQSVSISGSSPADLIKDENERSTTGNAVSSTLSLVYDLSIYEDDVSSVDGDSSGTSVGEEKVE